MNSSIVPGGSSSFMRLQLRIELLVYRESMRVDVFVCKSWIS